VDIKEIKMNEYIVKFDSNDDDDITMTYTENIMADDFYIYGSTAVFYKISEGNNRVIKLRAFSHVWEISLVEHNHLA
jgi:hypothetical protein